MRGALKGSRARVQRAEGEQEEEEEEGREEEGGEEEQVEGEEEEAGEGDAVGGGEGDEDAGGEGDAAGSARKPVGRGRKRKEAAAAPVSDRKGRKKAGADAEGSEGAAAGGRRIRFQPSGRGKRSREEEGVDEDGVTVLSDDVDGEHSQPPPSKRAALGAAQRPARQQAPAQVRRRALV